MKSERFYTVGNFSEKTWTNRFRGWNSKSGTVCAPGNNAPEPRVRAAIEKAIKKYGGDTVVDVKIHYDSTPLQRLLASLSAGIWTAETVTVSGTVVKAAN